MEFRAYTAGSLAGLILETKIRRCKEGLLYMAFPVKACSILFRFGGKQGSWGLGSIKNSINKT